MTADFMAMTQESERLRFRSSRKFYLTNDHYFVNGPLRYLEERLGPWNWATDVQYCDASQDVILLYSSALLCCDRG